MFVLLSSVALLWGRFRRPRGLNRRSAAAPLLALRVRFASSARMHVSSECCVLSDRGLCYGPIPHPEEPYGGCVCVLSVIRCNSNPLHLPWVCKTGRTKKERKKERKIYLAGTFPEVFEPEQLIWTYCNTLLIAQEVKLEIWGSLSGVDGVYSLLRC